MSDSLGILLSSGDQLSQLKSEAVVYSSVQYQEGIALCVLVASSVQYQEGVLSVSVC